MSLFQHSIVKRHLRKLDKETLETAWQKFTAHFHNPTIQANIRKAKEEQYQEGFLRDLFVNVLGYTLNPDENFNLTTELKNIKNAKKADGAILKDKYALAVIELKGMNIVSLNKAEEQAFGYKNNQPKCVYVITSNFGKLRFYIDNAVEFEEFNLFQLTKERFEVLYLCLCAKNLLKNLPKRMKEESITAEEDITKKLYADYSLFRKMLFENIVKNNPTYDKLTLFKKTQKLLDRFLFVFFAEDTGLVAPNTTRTILKQWADLRMLYDAYAPLYQRFQKYFGYLNEGYNGKTFQVFAYNGGLFAPDDILDSLKVNDEALYEHTFKLSKYDFASEVSVNILGHIFEHSLTEIEEIQAELSGKKRDKNKGKRKKDGVFYTPAYITKYIIDNTVGKLCKEKKAELGILETEEEHITANSIDLEHLKTYRKWLLSLTICDPACGSGAFLNQALEFLIAEHEYIDELQAAVLGETRVANEIENAILENNLFGVDINQESVEIAKLSLWLRTAKEGRKLIFLNENIKCGNSLIDDAEVAGDSAFVWEKEFPQVFENGGFDVVIGNPPYVRQELFKDIKPFLKENYECYNSVADLYTYFIERGFYLNKTKGLFSFIIPNKFLKATYGKEIRTVIKNKAGIISFYDFDDFPVFEEALTYPLIFVFQKKENYKEFKFSQINKKIVGEPFEELKKREVSIPIAALQDDGEWIFWNAKLQNLFSKIQATTINLGTYVEQQAYLGIKTGKNAAFIVSETTKKELIKQNNNSKNIIKPISAGKGVKRYHFVNNGLYLLFTQYNIDIPNVYPNVFEWLKAFEVDLKKRKDKGKNWWNLRPCDYYDKIQKPKIVWRSITNESAFYLDEEGSLMLSNNNYFIASDSHTLLGILNSKLIFVYLKNICTTLQGGYYDFRRDKVLTVPISKQIDKNKNIAHKTKLIQQYYRNFQKQKNAFLKVLAFSFEIEKLSKKLQNWYELSPAEFLKELQKKKIKLSLGEKSEWLAYFEEEKTVVEKTLQQIAQTDTEIDKMVYELYGLTKEEIKTVEEAV